MTKTNKVGFSGTRKGMTIEQKQKFKWLLEVFKKETSEFHHGMCLGADEEAHNMIREFNPDIKIHGHPPIKPYYESHVKVDFMWKRKDYLERNKDIVHCVDRIIAMPETKHEVLRSGTWSTIRYADKHGKCSIIIIYPDGSMNL